MEEYQDVTVLMRYIDIGKMMSLWMLMNDDASECDDVTILLKTHRSW